MRIGAWKSRLDVEWAHAIAPEATILLVEASSASFSDLLAAVKYAANYTGVSVVSMSWGTDEFNGETSYDSYFTTPAGHIGVTFVASSGDSGTTCWPSVASNVLAVGGTTLTRLPPAPTQRNGMERQRRRRQQVRGVAELSENDGISASGRVTPDVAYDANPSTGFVVYDSLARCSAAGWSSAAPAPARRNGPPSSPSPTRVAWPTG